MVNPTVQGRTDATEKPNAIDFSVLLNITANDKELSNQFLKKFIQEIAERKATIQAAYLNNKTEPDLENLDYHIHKLNGSAHFCGFLRIQAIAADIEDMLYRKEITPLDSAIEALFKAIDETVEAYKQNDF